MANQVYDFCDSESFSSIIASAAQEDTLTYMLEMARCVRTLHDMGIVHRDIKPANFLFSRKTGKGVLIDFGLCEMDVSAEQLYPKNNSMKRRLFERISALLRMVGMNKFGTDGYMPLETILKSTCQGFAVDVWAAGVIFLQLQVRKTSIFNQTNLLCYEKTTGKAQKIGNHFVELIILLALVFRPKDIEEYCDELGFIVKIPDDFPANPDNLVKIAGKAEVHPEVWQMTLRMISIRPTDRPTMKDVHYLLRKVKTETQNLAKNKRKSQELIT